MFVVIKGADAGVVDVLGRHTHLSELKSVAKREVDMPFLLANTEGVVGYRKLTLRSHSQEIHVEASSFERLIDFIAYFEVLESDARTDDRLAVCRLCAIV